MGDHAGLHGTAARLPSRVGQGWLTGVPACSMAQFRRKVRDGGQPVFLPDEAATLRSPAWGLMVLDGAGRLWRVTTAGSPVCRRLQSVQQAYQVARDAGLPELRLPVELNNPPQDKGR